MPKISVIIPIYNSEKRIKECMDSILKQTFKDFEVLAVYDNGTVDSTPKILEEYRLIDNRVNPINIGEERGLVKALNYGIKIAKGEFIARMDDDDISLPKRFEKQVEFLDKNNEVHILGGNVEVIGDLESKNKEDIENKLNIDINISNAREEILTHWYCFAHPSVMMRKIVIDNIGGYKNYIAEDLELWLRALKNGYGIQKLNDRLIKYRIHDNSKTKLVNVDYRGVKDGIRIKLLDVFDKPIKEDFKYIIWGAGNGGKMTKDMIEDVIPNSRCVGFIDKSKEGKFEEIEIFTQSNFNEINFDYIFIATEPGKEEAIKKLKSMNLTNILNFLCTI